MIAIRLRVRPPRYRFHATPEVLEVDPPPDPTGVADQVRRRFF